MRRRGRRNRISDRMRMKTRSGGESRSHPAEDTMLVQ